MILVVRYYTMECVRRTAEGLHRYKIGSDMLQVVGVSHIEVSFCSILANSSTRVDRPTHYSIVRPDSAYKFLGRRESLAGIRADRRYPFPD